MRRIRITFIAILLCLSLTASSAQSNGCFYSGAYWALPLLFIGVPVLAYTLSGGYSESSVYVQPSYVYYQSPPRSYQRTYYRTRSTGVDQPSIPATQALQSTIDDPGYRYYCRSPRGYYPDVVDCPLGWKKIIPAGPKSHDPHK